MSLRFAMLALVMSLLSPPASTADEPKRNPWRSATGSFLPDLPPPPAMYDLTRLIPMVGPDRSLEKGFLEIIEVALQGELDQLRFKIELREMEGRGKQFRTESLKREAEIKAEELIRQVRSEAVAAKLKECTKAETAARAEVARIRALKERPDDGSYRKALVAQDDAKLELAAAKSEFVRVQVELGEELDAIRRKAERAQADLKDPEVKLREQIETTKALLASVRMRILEIRFHVENPALSEAAQLREIIQSMRRELQKAQDGKKK